VILRQALLVAGIIAISLVFAVDPAECGVRMGRESALDSIVQVTVHTRFGTTRCCSGFLYSTNGYVVTPYHVVSDAVSIDVFHATHGVFAVDRVRRIDPRADIALLALAQSASAWKSCARLGDSRILSVGDELHVLHHAAFSDEVQTDTVISNLGYPRQLEEGYFASQYANELLLLVVQGNFDVGSTGGILCNSNYEVVGLILAAGQTTADGTVAYALASSYLAPFLNSTYDVSWDNLRTEHDSDADYFDRFFGPAPQVVDLSSSMAEGYLAWFAPCRHSEYADYEFTNEINDKIDKNWFYSENLVVDGRPIREWSASRIYVWPAYLNPWDVTDSMDVYVHFDADSIFSKRIYREREMEERIMTRHILAMPLSKGTHAVQYENRGANYRSTGTRRLRLNIKSSEVSMLDITGLSLVTMQLLPSSPVGVGEQEGVRYELERRPLGEKEINACIRHVRYPILPPS